MTTQQTSSVVLEVTAQNPNVVFEVSAQNMADRVLVDAIRARSFYEEAVLVTSAGIA